MNCAHMHDGECELNLSSHGKRPSPGSCSVCTERTELTLDRAPITPGRVASYVRAEASRVVGSKLTAEQIEARAAACRGCNVNLKREANGLGWCAECGCGGRKRAHLATKITMPKARCPRNLWPKLIQ
ncbi:MAG: hypothetical protein AAF432_00470 [Planctomycetota bacterium]